MITGEPAHYDSQDVAFAKAMIANHRQGIDFSALAPTHSGSTNVAAAAANTTTLLQADVATLKAMLVQWNENPNSASAGGESTTVTRGTVDPGTLARLQTVRGAQFDTLWLQSMIGLDRGAVEIADAEMAGTHNEDAVGLARQIIGVRQADIGQMTQLLHG